ncbi:MAG: DUF4398 domain-containing protein [Gammaproteobacteria bacterium]|nr:DUF4398 domain-containing protein [Gammaproteobacteria bacterium]
MSLRLWPKGYAQLTAALAMLTLAACAAPPPPDSALQAAEQAITSAERDKAGEYASADLAAARDKLVKARAAVVAEEMVRAERLAQQAEVDAMLALAKTDEAKARVINQQTQQSLDVLRQELQRNAEVKQ